MVVLAATVQEGTDGHVEAAFVDPSYAGEQPEQNATAQGIRLAVVKLSEATRNFVLLPNRWVVDCRCAWTSRLRRLAYDDARLPQILAGPLFAAFSCRILTHFIHLLSSP